MQRQIERENLDELIAAAEAEHGLITEQEIVAKREILARARDAGRVDPARENTA